MPILFVAAILTFLCMSSASAARVGVGLTPGYDNDDELFFIRGALKVDPGWRWFEQGDWYLGLHFDLGLIYIESGEDHPANVSAEDALAGVSLTPVFRLQRAPYGNTISPFVELAVGAAIFSEDELQSSEPGGVELGGSFQFEDIFSLGLRFGSRQQHELSASYYHYSNAGIYDHNDGINIAALTFSHWF